MNKKAQEQVDSLYVKIFLVLLYAMCLLFIIYFTVQILAMLQNDDPDMIAVGILDGEIRQGIYILEQSPDDFKSSPYTITFPLSMANNKYIEAHGVKQLCLYSMDESTSKYVDGKRSGCMALPANIESLQFQSFTDAYSYIGVPESKFSQTLVHPVAVLFSYKLEIVPLSGKKYRVTISFADNVQ